jgi:signal transduction histidine kinase
LNPTSRSKPKDPLGKRLADIDSIRADMAKMIEDMLAYARVSETAKKFIPIDCLAVFREVRDDAQSDIEAIGARVFFRPPLPIVKGHRESLKSVFRNLLSNAIKYRAERSLTVRVTAQLQEGEWLFSVRDNGSGIRKFPRYVTKTKKNNEWEKIFAPFYRDDEHVKRGPQGEEIPGHGIGLAYCRSVIEHHGGKIWVESESGKGSTFYFTLPAVPEAEDQG